MESMGSFAHGMNDTKNDTKRFNSVLVAGNAIAV